MILIASRIEETSKEKEEMEASYEEQIRELKKQIQDTKESLTKDFQQKLEVIFNCNFNWAYQPKEEQQRRAKQESDMKTMDLLHQSEVHQQEEENELSLNHAKGSCFVLLVFFFLNFFWSFCLLNLTLIQEHAALVLQLERDQVRWVSIFCFLHAKTGTLFGVYQDLRKKYEEFLVEHSTQEKLLDEKQKALDRALDLIRDKDEEHVHRYVL